MSDKRRTGKVQKTYSVYRIWNIESGKSYVGITSKGSEKRVVRHFKMLKYNGHFNPALQADFNQLGRKSFKWETLETDIHPLVGRDREQYYVAQFDSFYNGYNQDKGGHKRTGKACTWNGIEYESIADAARANNVLIGTMQSRLSQGHTCDEDVTPSAVPCTWNSIQYESISQAAEANNVSLATMSYWIKNGYTCDEDTSPLLGKNACTWNGIEYESIAEAAQANNVDYGTMYNRISRGIASDEQLKKHKHICIWNGVTYSSKAAAARDLGISPSSLNERLKKGYTCDSDMSWQRGGNS